MDLAHQHIAFHLNNQAEAECENRLMEKMEREATPLFFAVLFILAGMVFGAPLYFAGQNAAMKECPQVNQGERLVYSEQRSDVTLCNYSTGWDFGRRKVLRAAK